MKRIPILAAAAIAAAVALAGCGSSAEDMAGMDHGAMDHTASSSPSVSPEQSGAGAPGSDQSAGTEHNAADAMFATMMIPHHEQAITMSETMLGKENINPEVSELAVQIKAAQGPEIEKMSAWLEAWGEPVPIGGHGMGEGHSMEGMLSTEQLDVLASAEGTEAERLFLSQMVEHHQGAIGMAKQEIEQGSNPTAIALAKEIIAAQQSEIETMTQLLGNR